MACPSRKRYLGFPHPPGGILPSAWDEEARIHCRGRESWELLTPALLDLRFLTCQSGRWIRGHPCPCSFECA
jgi:hypothetical protein